MTEAGPGADFLQLTAAAAAPRGLTSWLAGAIRTAIIDGRLAPGTTLPATRLLAGDLGVSRGVVVEAYQRLADEGLVSARPGTGTRVSGRPPRPVRPKMEPPRPDPAATVLPQPWRARAELDLSPGVPDLAGFPRAAWLRAERSVLDQASVAELGYGDPRGSGWLRRELASWLARTRGLHAGADDIIIVSGVAQALACWPSGSARTARPGSPSRIPAHSDRAASSPTGGWPRCRSRSTSKGCRPATSGRATRGPRC